jgi:hypothetical protein
MLMVGHVRYDNKEELGRRRGGGTGTRRPKSHAKQELQDTLLQDFNTLSIHSFKYC